MNAQAYGPFLLGALLGCASGSGLSPSSPTRSGSGARTALGDDFPSVITAAGPGRVDWTELILRANVESLPEVGAFAARTVVEQQALRKLGPTMLEASSRVRIDGNTTTGDLIRGGTRLGALLDEDSSSWRVRETRYHRSGRIEMDGVLDLLQWTRPVLLSMESQAPSVPGTSSDHSGVLVDARGLDLEPSLAPRFWASTGELLYGIETLPAGTCRSRIPVGWVSDPADPRAYRRVGDKPLLIRATAVRGRTDLVLEPEDALSLLKARQDPAILSEARVIVVAGPS